MMSAAEFEFLRALVRARSAIVIEAGKEYLVESRMAPVLRDRNLATMADLVAALRAAPGSELEWCVVEAMTTNETSWFRDVHPFEALKTVVLPDLIASRASERSLRIWSGACSSGQEAYSVAIMLADHFPALASWEVSILATDISHAMVRRTGRACYEQLEVNRGLTPADLARHFERVGSRWRVNAELRGRVHARQLNLAEPWPPLPRFDLILLRNVLIYFDHEVKRAVLRRARQALCPDGLLFLGSSESMLNLDDSWERITCGRAVAYRAIATGSARTAGAACECS
jgi:chemotaxis protein methyltransferase CheR